VCFRGVVEFRILGPLEILDGERVLPLGGLKRRAVVAALLLHPNRVVSSEQLVDLVWGVEPPAAAQSSLQNHVLRLRRELGDRLVTRPPGYLLRVEPGELDLDRFRTLIGEARIAEPGEAAARLQEALALWRGDPVADLAGEPVGVAAAHLAELRLDALENRIDADLALGRHAEVVPELEALVGEHPFRERLRGQLMLALYRSGRQADALETYSAARAMFDEQLGTQPGAQLKELQRTILRQEAELAGPAAVPGERPARVEEARKTVTVLLADLAVDAGSDPEVARDRLRHRREEEVAAVAAHGGTAGRTAETRVLGIFGVPVAHEDDALRAVRAARGLVADGLVTRAGVATGDVITGDPAHGRPLVSGAPLEEADRLRAAATHTDVLLGERAWRLVRHAVTAERQEGGHLVRDVSDEAEPVVRRLETPLVGREDEIAEIVAAFRRTTRDGRARLVTVFGSPGVGKTRLAREVVDRLSGSATCVVGRTPAYGQAATYAPLRDAFSALASGTVAAWATELLADERDGELLAAKIAAVAGEAPSTGPVEETAWAVRRLLETLARERPVVIVLEDLHWAAPVFLDLVEHVAELARAPILLLCLARPDILDTRPEWAGGRLSASSILLDALPNDEARMLLEGLAGDTALDDEARAEILAGAAGNPLFLEQLLASALESGEIDTPDSIHALLSARLDRLPEAERRIAQAAAVYGQTFPTGVLQAVVGADVRPALITLARRDFVELEAPDAFGDETWGFRHVLVRDEAYAGIPKRRRAALHRQIAGIVVERAARRGVEADELIGYHLESAHRAQIEVDPQAPELAPLAADAARHLSTAGLRAYDERDPATSAGLLRRAAALLPFDAPERLALAPVLSDALSWGGDRESAARVLEEAEAAAPPDDKPLQARLLIARCNLELWGPVAVDPVRMLEDVRNAIAVLEAAGDDEALAYARIVAYHASYRRSAGAGLAQLDLEEEFALAAKHARAAGSRHLEGMALSWLCVILRRGWQPVEAAKRRMVAILEDPPNRFTQASALGGLGTLRAMEGAFEEARALMAENHALLEELGLRQSAAADSIALADVEIMAGDLEAGERYLRAGLAELDAIGDRYGVVNAAWRLALVLARSGRNDEAEAFVERAAELGAGEWTEAWRLVLGATLAARRGDTPKADRLLRESEALMDSLFEVAMHADALLQAAEASELLGRTADAVDRLSRAAEIAQRLGYVIAERTARERLAALG